MFVNQTTTSLDSLSPTSVPVEDTLGRNAFLNLLVTQLQNQDPTQPQADGEFLAQRAQSSQLEQRQQLNDKLDALAGLHILDIGCGGGILSELLARLGAEVVGADPSQPNIEAAKLHAAEAGVTVDCRAATAEVRARRGGGRRAVRVAGVISPVAAEHLHGPADGPDVRRGRRPGGLRARLRALRHPADLDRGPVPQEHQ